MPSVSEPKIRIAIILTPREVFSPTSAGAIAMVVQRLAGVTPDAVVIGAARRDGEKTFAGIVYVPAAGTFAIIAALRRLKPDFIDVHQQPRLALILSYVFPRARILLFLHNDPLTMRGLKTRFGRRVARRRLHRIICVSEYLQNRLMTGLAGPIPAVLPNPLTLSALPAPVGARTNTILFAGRIVHDKGPDVFIAACRLALPVLPGWSAAMLGGDRFGPHSPETGYVAATRAAAATAGIAFTGPLPHAEVLAAMSQAAIVVVPSRWAEPFGLAALEAIANGAALITTTQGGLPEIAGDAAVYVPPDDAPALAAAIVALANDEPHRAALAAAGLVRATQFDTPLIAAALEKLRQTV